MNKIKKYLNFNTIVSIIGIIIGIVSIGIGIMADDFNYHYNGTVGRKSYGGDAYTGIQQACAQAATNSYHIYEVFQVFSKIFFIIVGLLIVLHYAEKLFYHIQILKDEIKKMEVE